MLTNHQWLRFCEIQRRTISLEMPWLWWCSVISTTTSLFALYMLNCLTHWGRVTHIFIKKLTIIGSDNGLSPGRRQAIIWNNVGKLLIGPLGTNFSEISIEIQLFSFKKMHLKMSSAKWRPFCLGLNVLIRNVKIWLHFLFSFFLIFSNLRCNMYSHSQQMLLLTWAPLLTWYNLNPAWISNHIHCKVWDWITYRFPNFSSCIVELWISMNG